jgi:hypothetical protein
MCESRGIVYFCVYIHHNLFNNYSLNYLEFQCEPRVLVFKKLEKRQHITRTFPEDTYSIFHIIRRNSSLNKNIFGLDCLYAFVNFLVVAKTHHNPVYPAVAVNHFGQPENFIFFNDL